jgi:hypothetical protein
MKLAGTFLFSVLAIAAGSDAKLFGKDKPAYEDWSLDQSLAFLKDQGIKVRDSPTLEEVRKQVLANADAAATVCSPLYKRGQSADMTVGCWYRWFRSGSL